MHLPNEIGERFYLLSFCFEQCICEIGTDYETLSNVRTVEFLAGPGLPDGVANPGVQNNNWKAVVMMVDGIPAEAGRGQRASHKMVYGQVCFFLSQRQKHDAEHERWSGILMESKSLCIVYGHINGDELLGRVRRGRCCGCYDSHGILVVCRPFTCSCMHSMFIVPIVDSQRLHCDMNLDRNSLVNFNCTLFYRATNVWN